MLSPMTLESPGGGGTSRRSSLLPRAPPPDDQAGETNEYEWRDPRDGPSLPQTLLDYLIAIPYLFIGVTVALAGLLVSCAAIVFQFQPPPRDVDSNSEQYRRRPVPRRRRILLTDSPLSSPSASPPFRATTTTTTGASFLGSPGSSAASSASTTGTPPTFRARPRRQSVRSNRSWQASELERVSEDEDEHISSPTREMGRRGTWAGPESEAEVTREDAAVGGNELESVPSLVLDGGSSETSSEVDTLPDADLLHARYGGLLGWGTSNVTVLKINNNARGRNRRDDSSDAQPFSSSSSYSPRIPIAHLDVKAKPPAATHRFRNPFRSRLAPPEPSPDPSSASSSTSSSPSASPRIPSPASSSSNLAGLGSYFNTPPGHRPR